MTQSKTKTKEYAVARQCMIESQIHPMGVTSEALLEAFSIIPREVFVPNDKGGFSYCDEDVEISEGRYLMEPSVLARLIQAAEPNKGDVALTIGSGIGYNASILSHLVSTVVALEENKTLVNQAQKCWDQLGLVNIAGLKGALIKGEPENAPYDIIIINGAVSEIPEDIKNQLSIGGRLAALIKKSGQSVAKATLIKRIDENIFSDIVLFDAGTPYLKGFEPKKEFVF